MITQNNVCFLFKCFGTKTEQYVLGNIVNFIYNTSTIAISVKSFQDTIDVELHFALYIFTTTLGVLLRRICIVNFFLVYNSQKYGRNEENPCFITDYTHEENFK